MIEDDDRMGNVRSYLSMYTNTKQILSHLFDGTVVRNLIRI